MVLIGIDPHKATHTAVAVDTAHPGRLSAPCPGAVLSPRWDATSAVRSPCFGRPA